ncbi:hypothetical protein OXIME_001066 [Oxyplasma meridianum]|uniref:Uncharacterized protein n=1 Tax=Oxyplasma meridianum TaxID=3073602 RepID=A0AAX4NG65_9ARCH
MKKHGNASNSILSVAEYLKKVINITVLRSAKFRLAMKWRGFMPMGITPYHVPDLEEKRIKRMRWLK